MEKKNNDNWVEDLNIKLTAAPPPSPIKIPAWKRIFVVGVVLLFYAVLMAGVFFFPSAGVKLIFIVAVIAYVFLCKYLVSGLKKLLKFPDENF